MEISIARLFLMAFFVMAFSVSSYSQRDWEGVTLNKKELTPPIGEIPEQYNFLITKEDTTGLELLAFNSFFRLKDNERQFYREEQRNIALRLAIVDKKYPWLTEEEFQSKVVKKAVCRGVNGTYIMSIE